MNEDTKRGAQYRVVHIDDMPDVPYEWAPEMQWKPVRRYFEIGSFGANLFRVTKAGDILTEEHTEDPESGTRHEELYLVVAGRATFTVGGDSFDAPAGTFVYVPDPTTRRGAVGREAGTILLALGGEPGCVFTPSEWDLEPLPD